CHSEYRSKTNCLKQHRAPSKAIEPLHSKRMKHGVMPEIERVRNTPSPSQRRSAEHPGGKVGWRANCLDDYCCHCEGDECKAALIEKRAIVSRKHSDAK